MSRSIFKINRLALVMIAAGVLGAGAGGGGGAAVAQIATVTAQTAEAGTAVSEVVVTGSRIPEPNLRSLSPIATVSGQTFKLQGHADVIDLLNTLPQSFQNNVTDFSNTSNPLNGPGGISTADLRGLGPQRTLVLVNGRRLGIGDANTGNNNPAPDLDQIPAAMIDRVEVVTGGASATYGSDALAGVVNFILKQNFQGVEIDAQGGGYSHTQQNKMMQGLEADAGNRVPGNTFDGQNVDVSIILGQNFHDRRGNVTGYFAFHNQEPVLAANRDFSACELQAGLTPGSGFCNGSQNSNFFQPLTGPNANDPNGFTQVGGQFLGYPQANSVPPPLFNSNAFEYLSRKDTRYLGGFEAHYDFSKQVSVYSEFSYMRDYTTEQVAPSGLFAFGNVYDPLGGNQINCDNPLLSSQEQSVLGCSSSDIAVGNFVDTIIGRRNIEGSPRQSVYDHENYRAVFGVKGDATDAWHYDVYGSYYYTNLVQRDQNYLSLAKIANALDVVSVAGIPTCQSVIDHTDPRCVPYNIFADNGVTSSAVKYLTETGTQSGTVKEWIFEGDLTGDLGKYGVKTPWADDGVHVAVGFDWRRDTLNFQPDAIELSGDLSGGPGIGAAIQKGIGVWEGYGETRVPILQNVAWAKDVEAEAGIRYSTYSTGPKTWTFRYGLEWSPTSDIRFRASYQRATRAPSVIELFTPATLTQSAGYSQGDPCAGQTPAASLAACELTGVTPAQYGNILQCPSNQCDVSLGGNTELKPETAYTYSVGVTITPASLKNFMASIDYWDIRLSNLINSLPPDIILTQCMSGIESSCALIHRGATGELIGATIATNGFIEGTSINVNKGETSGIDFQGAYVLNLDDVGAKDFGSLTFDLNAVLLLKNITVQGGSQPYDCAGLFGSKCQTVNPKWRHTLRITWNTPWNVLASLQWRYIGGVKLDTNTSNPVLSNGQFDEFDAALEAVNYLDLALEWRITHQLTLRAGVNNVFDQDPPVVTSGVAGTGAPNTYPTYDLLGREIFASATARF